MGFIFPWDYFSPIIADGRKNPMGFWTFLKTFFLCVFKHLNFLQHCSIILCEKQLIFLSNKKIPFLKRGEKNPMGFSYFERFTLCTSRNIIFHQVMNNLRDFNAFNCVWKNPIGFFLPWFCFSHGCFFSHRFLLPWDYFSHVFF